MKDFHDLYSLARLGVLDDSLAKKAILLVFHHRKTSLEKLPISFDKHGVETLEKTGVHITENSKQGRVFYNYPSP